MNNIFLCIVNSDKVNLLRMFWKYDVFVGNLIKFIILLRIVGLALVSKTSANILHAALYF